MKEDEINKMSGIETKINSIMDRLNKDKQLVVEENKCMAQELV